MNVLLEELARATMNERMATAARLRVAWKIRSLRRWDRLRRWISRRAEAARCGTDDFSAVAGNWRSSSS